MVDEATMTTVKCACADCVGMVATDKAVHKDGKSYCCEACASGHAGGTGCCHKGCDCHG